LFIPGRPFQSSLIFANKARAYSNELVSVAPLLGRLLAVPGHIRLGWKSLSRTNTSLLPKFVNYDRKKFYSIGPISVSLGRMVVK
jgi:hypothetical protein